MMIVQFGVGFRSKSDGEVFQITFLCASEDIVAVRLNYQFWLALCIDGLGFLGFPIACLK